MLPFPLTATRARVAALLTTTLVLAESGRAAAQPKTAVMSARLELVADPSCTTRSDLMARVRRRSPRVVFGDDPGALAVRARFSALRPGAVAGDLTLARAGAVPSTRRVVARSCTEAADAVALMIAVTLDPASVENTEPSDTTPPARAPSGDAEPSKPSDHNGAAAEPNTPASSTAPGAPEKPPERPALKPSTSETTPPSGGEPERPSAPMRGLFSAELAAEAFAGPTPGLMPAFGLFVLAGVDRVEPWSPSVFVGATHAWRPGLDEPGGRVSFELDAASLDACPLRLRLAFVDARPCVSVLLGRFSARGTDTNNPTGESVRPFSVVGGSVLARARLVWLLEASARVAVGASVVRDSFEFGSTVFHRVDPVTANVSLGLGVRLP